MGYMEAMEDMGTVLYIIIVRLSQLGAPGIPRSYETGSTINLSRYDPFSTSGVAGDGEVLSGSCRQ